MNRPLISAYYDQRSRYRNLILLSVSTFWCLSKLKLIFSILKQWLQMYHIGVDNEAINAIINVFNEERIHGTNGVLCASSRLHIPH